MDFRDVIRDLLTVDYMKTCKKINCSEVSSRTEDGKLILFYNMWNEDGSIRLIEMEYVDNLLNRIYMDGEIDFDYNKCN